MCASVPSSADRSRIYAQQTSTTNAKDSTVNMQLSLAPIIALLAGILILVQPRLLNDIVAIYLIVIGLLGLFGASGFHFH